jgi:uncharacterized protein YjbJ (UPF0337 family)
MAGMQGASRLGEEEPMDADALVEQWEELRDDIRRRWGRLTDEDLDEIEGDREVLTAKLQEAYGQSEDEATAEIELFLEPY